MRKGEEKVRLPKVTRKEREVIVHALLEEHDRIGRTGGEYYGTLTLMGFKGLINRLREEKPDPIELYLKGFCPDCNVPLWDEHYCPKCGTLWRNAEILKRFW